MIAIQIAASFRPSLASFPIASPAGPATRPDGSLDVTDGLVSIGQQAWMNGVSTSVLH